MIQPGDIILVIRSRPTLSANKAISERGGLIMLCQSCGLERATKDVTLHQNIGMLMMRRSQTIKGSLCKPCIDSYFWRFLVVSATLGWWGLISLIMTPI